MLRRFTIIALFAIVFAVFAQAASADPPSAKTAAVFTANCGATQLLVVANGDGEFTPAHVIGRTAVFVPTRSTSRSRLRRPTAQPRPRRTRQLKRISPGMRSPATCLRRRTPSRARRARSRSPGPSLGSSRRRISRAVPIVGARSLAETLLARRRASKTDSRASVQPSRWRQKPSRFWRAPRRSRA
jgi:hypothetical protein